MRAQSVSVSVAQSCAKLTCRCFSCFSPKHNKGQQRLISPVCPPAQTNTITEQRRVAARGSASLSQSQFIKQIDSELAELGFIATFPIIWPDPKRPNSPHSQAQVRPLEGHPNRQDPGQPLPTLRFPLGSLQAPSGPLLELELRVAQKECAWSLGLEFGANFGTRIT